MITTRLIKSFVQRRLRNHGFEIRPLTASEGEPIPLCRILVERCLMEGGEGAIFQVGANDGVLKDPVREIILAHNLPALLVEPLPDIRARLESSYAGHPKVRIIGAAVGTTSGRTTMYRIRAGSEGLPDWAQGLASMDRSVIAKHRDWRGVDRALFDRSIEEVEVPVRTVGDILGEAAGIGRFLMFQVDTEGHDLEVLRSAAAAGFFPPIVSYEHKHLGLADQRAARLLLAERGYTFFTMGPDTLAWRAA